MTGCTSGGYDQLETSPEFFPINAPSMGRFQLFDLEVLGYALDLKFWVVIAVIVSLTLTITTAILYIYKLCHKLNHNSNDNLTQMWGE